VGVALTLGLVGGVGLKIATSHDTQAIPDSAFSPPDGVRVVSDDGGSCGSGNDFECGRFYTVLADDASAADLRARAIQRLDGRGWDGSLLSSGSWACKDHGHLCVQVVRFADDWQYSAGSDDEKRWAEVFGIPSAELDTLRERGVAISFSDCCGDRWPF
jgi:hypothetical protein